MLPYTGNYKTLGEMVWTKIKSHGDKIACVSRYSHQYKKKENIRDLQ